MFKDFYSPSSYIDNSYIQEKSYACTTKVRILYKNDTKCPHFIYYVAKLYLFSAQEPKAPVTYCDHALSGVRRPSVRPLDNLHFQLLLQNRSIDFDETWYGWSTQGPLQVLLFFGQIRPGADPGRGQNRSRGSPFSKNFFFRPEGYSNKPNA